MNGPAFVRRLLLLFGGFVVWFAHLSFLYSFHALACARQFAATEVFGVSVVNQAAIAATVCALGANAWIFIAAAAGWGPGIGDEGDPSVREFWRYLTAVTAALSIVAVIWSAVPMLVIRPCA